MLSSTETQPRGVWRLPWKGAFGESYYAVVAGDGRQVYISPAYEGADLDALIGALWDLLDRVDPVRDLLNAG